MLGVVDKLMERGLPPTGAPNIGGSLVTAGGLVFIGATNDSRFRAFDKDTGKELWVTRLPASAHATPMTFRGRKSGRQFVVIAAGGGNKYNSTYSDSLMAFALPSGAPAGPVISSAKEISRERARDAVKPDASEARTDEVFSHAVHEAAEFECSRCHATAATGDRAGFPTGKACLPCHRAVAQNKLILPPVAGLPASRFCVLPPQPACGQGNRVQRLPWRRVEAGPHCAGAADEDESLRGLSPGEPCVRDLHRLP